jgi:allantoinase
MHVDLLIKGDLVLEQGILKDGVVAINGGIIVGILGRDDVVQARETIDAGGSLVFPGVVDAHVHSYSNLSEGFEHSTQAAACGGVTTIIEMPYDATGIQTTPERFQKKIDLIHEVAKVDVALLATVPKEGDREMIAPLVGMGACGFKLSLNEADPVRFPRIADGVLWTILPEMAAHGVPVGFHAENEEIIQFLVDQYRREGKTFPHAHCETRPPVSESTAVLKLLELAHWTGCRLHIYHVSHPRCIHLIQAFRRDGVDVSMETCPHYLILNEEDMKSLGAFAKINPPLRSQEAVDEMWELLKAGAIDMVASDHAPWPLQKKMAPDIFHNASGAPGVETILPLLFSEGVSKRGLSPWVLGRLLCLNPAKRFGLYPKKGSIAVGADADFAILEPSVRWTISSQEMHSSSEWTPYEGLEVQGKVVRTILRGKTIYDGREVIADPGYGRFVPAMGFHEDSSLSSQRVQSP